MRVTTGSNCPTSSRAPSSKLPTFGIPDNAIPNSLKLYAPEWRVGQKPPTACFPAMALSYGRLIERFAKRFDRNNWKYSVDTAIRANGGNRMVPRPVYSTAF